MSIGPLSNRLLVGAVIGEALALVGFVYFPPIQQALGHAPLGPGQWVLVLATPWIFLAAEELRKAVVPSRIAAREAKPNRSGRPLPVAPGA